MVGMVGGMQLICMGILGEYVGRIYELALRRPSVIVEDSFESGAAFEATETERQGHDGPKRSNLVASAPAARLHFP